MRDPIVYIWNGLSLLLLDSTEASRHTHYALEIYMALESPFLLDLGNGWMNARLAAIHSNVPHRFDGRGGLCALILVNPRHELAPGLRRGLLNGVPYLIPEMETAKDTMEQLLQLPSEKRGPDIVKQIVIDFLLVLSGSAISKQPDSRIDRVLEKIQQNCRDGIGLEELASAACLSPSRTRHLFKEQTGLTIRQYILNLRVLEAVKLIISGSSKTAAAHEAGFADSAHLSRTFRSVYGLTLSDLYQTSRNSCIYLCP